MNSDTTLQCNRRNLSAPQSYFTFTLPLPKWTLYWSIKEQGPLLNWILIFQTWIFCWHSCVRLRLLWSSGARLSCVPHEQTALLWWQSLARPPGWRLLTHWWRRPVVAAWTAQPPPAAGRPHRGQGHLLTSGTTICACSGGQRHSSPAGGPWGRVKSC